MAKNQINFKKQIAMNQMNPISKRTILSNNAISIVATVLILAIISISTYMPNHVMAQGQAIQGQDVSVIPLQNPLKADSIGALVKDFVDILSYIAVILAVLVIIYIGFSFVMARGRPEEMKRLKIWLGWTVIGVAVIIGARVIVDVVINTLSSTGTVSPGIIQSVKKANEGK